MSSLGIEVLLAVGIIAHGFFIFRGDGKSSQMDLVS